MNPMNLLLLLVVGTIGGCAATIPDELAMARATYLKASQGQAATLVPSDLHKAHQALLEAEASFEADPRGYHTKDLAYVAQRKAELAQALAATEAQQQATAAANAQYQSTQDAIMLDTKARLGTSESDLAATKSAAALTAEQLASAKRSGADATQNLAASRAAEAATAQELVASRNAGADTADRLAASEAGRADAEARASAAATALAKLAAVKEEARGLVITLSGSVLFTSDEATLASGATARLGEVATALLGTKERTLLIEGHTDSQGSDAHNLELSQRRADAVRTFLTTRGYDPKRIRAVGMGEGRPVGDNATAEGRANNRRVEIVLEPIGSASK